MSLIVVLGAGASKDCASPNIGKNNDYSPPLVTELFSGSNSFRSILDFYPFAQSAAAEIRLALKDSKSLEECIRTEFKESKDIYDKRKFLELPLYLQDLLWTVGRNYTTFPDNYDLLIRYCFDLDDVIFITLNYDLLLDNRLSNYDELDSLDSYISQSRKWSLVKLHGSVNWARKVKNSLDGLDLGGKVNMLKVFRRFGENLEVDEINDIILRQGDVEAMRTDANTALYYPALSVPVGSDDELICPKGHLEFLEKKLSELESLNLLLIGYSGYDREVLKLLKVSGKKVNSILAVNGSEESGRKLIFTISQALSFIPTENMVYKGTFNDFVQTGELQSFISELKQGSTL